MIDGQTVSKLGQFIRQLWYLYIMLVRTRRGQLMSCLEETTMIMIETMNIILLTLQLATLFGGECFPGTRVVPIHRFEGSLAIGIYATYLRYLHRYLKACT